MSSTPGTVAVNYFRFAATMIKTSTTPGTTPKHHIRLLLPTAKMVKLAGPVSSCSNPFNDAV